MSPDISCSCFLTNFFTCDERVGASSDGVAMPEEEEAFLGAMAKKEFKNRGNLQKSGRNGSDGVF